MNTETEPQTASARATFRCLTCAHVTSVRAALAGKRARCPHCGHVGNVVASIGAPADSAAGMDSAHLGRTVAVAAELAARVPRPASGREAVPPQPHPDLAGRRTCPTCLQPLPDKNAEPTVRCPYCREHILQAARKCRHCGEYLDETLRKMATDEAGRDRPRAGAFPAAVSLKLALIVGACVLVGVGGIAAAVMFRGHGGAVPVTPVAQIPAGVAAGNEAQPGKPPAAAPGLEKLAAALEKELAGKSVRDASGSTLTFETSDKGIVPWGCQARAGAAGKGPLGSVTVPYRLASAEPRKMPSSRGRYVLELAQAGPQWTVESVLKEARALVKGETETEVPEDDRAAVKQPDSDFAVQHFKRVLLKLQPSNAD